MLTGSAFKAGDLVRIGVSTEVLKELQRNHGGWSSLMSKDIGQVGTVLDLTSKEDVIVEFKPKHKLVVNPAALVKISAIKVGHVVTIITDVDETKRLQEGHGGWSDLMKLSLGKSGKVLEIDSCGDLRVEVDGTTWTLNPACCILAREDGSGMDEGSSAASGLEAAKKTSPASRPAPPPDTLFKAGDLVQINLPVDILEELQKVHGQWVPAMSKDIGKTGTVLETTAAGDVVVAFKPKRKWVLNPIALTKVPSIQAGSIVTIISDITQAKRLQAVHGGWNELMTLSLGKRGKVVKVDSDGDLRVKVNGFTWAFNPACCTLTGEDEDGRSNDESSSDDSSDASRKTKKLLRSALKTRSALGAAFKMGDAVTIISDLNKVKSLQEGHGGYNVLMRTVLGKTGKVIHVYADGDPKVRINGHRWKFNPACCSPATDAEKEAMDPSDTSSCDESSDETSSEDSSSEGSSSDGILGGIVQAMAQVSQLSRSDVETLAEIVAQSIKKHKFKVGDMATILGNQAKVKKLQKHHGGWNSEMQAALGKTGKVVHVYDSGELRVDVEGRTWTFNPACCLPAGHQKSFAYA